MSVFEIIIASVVGIMLCACAYRGVFGLFLWKWTRIPFAMVGSMLLAVGMNGVPVMPREEEEIEQDAEMAATEDEEPKDEDNQAAKHVWSLRGMTPNKVKEICAAQAYGQHASDPEFEDIAWGERKSGSFLGN